MAIPFLNNLNLRDNQLQNAKVHVTSSAPTAAKGQIYLNSADNILKYHNGTTWVDVVSSTGGTVTNVTSSTIDQLTVANGTTTPQLTIVTAAVGNGELALATGDQIYDFVISRGYITGNQTITLTGDITGSGTTSISTTIASGAVDFAMINPAVVITEAEGIASNDNDVTLPTSAAVKAYVDDSVAGGLVYQGGYNAATNTPDLDVSPSPSINTGFTYTVTADGLFFTEQVRVGDMIIAEVDSPSTLADWTTVQNNVDIADATTIGIGNVKESVNPDAYGVSVSYTGGTASLGLDINGLTIEATPDLASTLAIYEDASSENKKIELDTLAGIFSAATQTNTTYAATISDTAVITHGLSTNDVIVQLYDVITNETVYADVVRTSTTQVTVTFAATPTNSVRVLVQKIG